MPALLLISVAGLLVALFYKFILYPGFFSPFAKVPRAHFSVAFTSAWIGGKRPNGAVAVQMLLEAHKKLGPIVRLSPDEISVASLEGLRKVYTGGFEKAQEYEDEFMNYGIPNLVSTLKNGPHSVRKRMISHVYSKSYIQNSTDLRTLSEILLFERLFPTLQSAAADCTAVDAYGLNQAMAVDFTTAFLFGIDNSTKFIDDIDARQKFMRNWRAKKDRVDAKRSTQELEDYVWNMCQAADRTRKSPNSRPIVYYQLSSQLSKSPVPAKQKDVIVASEMFDHMAASIDTSMVALAYLEWELSRNPELQTALRKELKSLPFPLSYAVDLANEQRVLPDPKELDALPLLHAVIKEVLRLYTPTPALLNRVTPPGGAVIEGYTIPGGITIGTSGKCMHRNEKVFPDAEAFKPERWLSDETEENCNRLKEMNRWFWAFGSGGRMCVGNHFATHSK